ncbi:MAG: MFS transporter [Dehalococcoidia bacterium]
MKAFTRGFSALQHRNYRLFWYGQTISLIGTWMQNVAQAWLVLQITGSAFDLGIVSALQMLPMLVVGPFGGVLADRLPKRRVLVVTQTVQMLLAFVLGALVMTGTVQIWHVYLLATLLGITNAFDAPTRQAFVMEMVGRGDLMNAVALGSMQFNAARIVGPALAGFSIALIGVTGSFFANGISFMFVIGGLMMMRTTDFYAVEPAPRASVMVSLREGAAYVWRSPAIMMLTVLVGILGLFAFNSQVLVPLFAKDVLHSGAAGYGILMAAMGGGSLVAALVAAFVQRARWGLLIGGSAGYCAFMIFFALSRMYWGSVVLIAIAGFALITFFTSANTGVQQQVPDQLRGRVMGVYMTVNMGITPFGNLATGALAASFGAPFAMGLGAGIALVFTSIAAVWLYFHRSDPRLVLEPLAESLPVRHVPEPRIPTPALHGAPEPTGEPVLAGAQRSR